MAWTNWPPRYSGRPSSRRTTATSWSIVRRPSSSLTRSCASAAHAQASTALGWQPVWRGELGRRQAGGARVAHPREEPELDAEVHQPRAMEPAEAGDQVVEAVVESHPAPDCRMARAPDGWRPGTVTSSPADPAQRFAAAPGSGERWIPTARSSPRSPRTSTDRSRPSCWPTRTGSIRSPCACSAIRVTPRRPPRTPSSVRTGRCPGTTRHGSASSGSGRGWPRSCSTCVARD